MIYRNVKIKGGNKLSYKNHYSISIRQAYTAVPHTDEEKQVESEVRGRHRTFRQKGGNRQTTKECLRGHRP